MSPESEGKEGGVAQSSTSDRNPALILGIFIVVWCALAIAPSYRMDWLLENLLTFAFVPALVLTYRRFRFSDRAYFQGLLFLTLHTIGSHYTYSESPLGQWMSELFGWNRNHYDRIVHFCFGLLSFRALLEITFRGAGQSMRRAEKLFLIVAEIAFFSVLYEISEWLVAAIVDPDAGAAFLGAQGDPWDAQKDMGLACIGAVIAALFELRAVESQRLRAREAPSDGAPTSEIVPLEKGELPGLARGSLSSTP